MVVLRVETIKTPEPAQPWHATFSEPDGFFAILDAVLDMIE
jgi:hypothetical protein